jgi:release factor glutamine methyltransferase
MLVREWIAKTQSRLKSLEIQSPLLEAQMLAAHAVGVDRTWLFAHPESNFPESLGNVLLERRAAGEPLAYILGWREFYGRRFGVDPSVLIPRQETETLIEAALRHFPANPNPIETSQISVLDLGTGSGILAITLKLERPDWEVTAIDISADALSTASANAKFLQANVKFVLSDAFDSLLGESYDLIVSNPPYIGRSESLPDEVAKFEPKLALFADDHGYAFYKMLADQSSNYLTDGGVLILEVGHTQAQKVTEIFLSRSWTPFDETRDLSGTLRVLGFRYEF